MTRGHHTASLAVNGLITLLLLGFLLNCTVLNFILSSQAHTIIPRDHT